ncbi:unnamed protein product [Prunus brigantina]
MWRGAAIWKRRLDVCLSNFSFLGELIGSGYLGGLLTWHPRARKVFLLCNNKF